MTEVKTVKNDMPRRRIFATVQEATAYLNSMVETLSDFETTAAAMVGVDEEGNFDSTLYNADTQVAVCVLMSKQDVKAITVAPFPTVDSLLSDAAGREWVEKVLAKELSHVSVRPLRDAKDIASVVDQMPRTREDYIASGRGQASGIMEAFNETYKRINTILSAKSATWRKARFVKAELKKCFESTAYATEYYPAVEDRGEAESMFVLAIKLGIATCKRDGIDPTIYERFLETRDDKEFTPVDDTEEDEDSLDLDALTEEMLEDESE